MGFIAAAVPLVEPLRGTVAGRPEKPEGMGGRVKTFAGDHPPGQIDFALAGRLIKVSFLHRLESSRGLKNHLPDRADRTKIQAIRTDPVYPDISDHQHSEFPVPFRFGPDQAGQELHISFIVRDYSHIVSPVSEKLGGAFNNVCFTESIGA